MKIFLYMLGLLFLLTSCGREEPEITPWPYELVELTQNAGEDNEFRIPAWFDPATGETAAVCGETSHGEGCLFWSESYYDPNFIPWRDTLFWGKKTADGYVLAAYSTESGTERTVCKIRHPSNFRVVGDYLCVGNSMELTHRMYLPDWREDTSPAGSMPDWVDGDTAYYLIRGARGRDGGIYRQNLYETGERPPVRNCCLPMLLSGTAGMTGMPYSGQGTVLCMRMACICTGMTCVPGNTRCCWRILRNGCSRYPVTGCIMRTKHPCKRSIRKPEKCGLPVRQIPSP